MSSISISSEIPSHEVSTTRGKVVFAPAHFLEASGRRAEQEARTIFDVIFAEQQMDLSNDGHSLGILPEEERDQHSFTGML